MLELHREHTTQPKGRSLLDGLALRSTRIAQNLSPITYTPYTYQRGVVGQLGRPDRVTNWQWMSHIAMKIGRFSP